MAELALAGFVLSRMSDAHKLMTSIRTRVSKYRKGPDAYKVLTDSVEFLQKQVYQVESMLATVSSALPSNICAVFNDTFSNVCNSLEEADSIIDISFSTAFTAIGSGTSSKTIPKLRQFTRANKLNDEMNALKSKIEKSSDQLLHLVSMLGNALKMDEQHAMVTSKFDNLSISVDNLRDEVRGNSRNDEPKYIRQGSTPALQHTVRLKFNAKDAQGKPATPEGTLKVQVLSSASSGDVTAAAGVMNPAYGIVGMAGVGKTIALQGLAFDKDIQMRFEDGVHYMSLGQGATWQSIIHEVARIMRITGAKHLVQSVEKSRSLRDAIDHAVMWFGGKTCLFLVDDIWPTDNCQTGYLNTLRQLVRGSPRSRIAISTRSVAIALGAGSMVHFGARDPLGPISETIFLTYAFGSTSVEDPQRQFRPFKKSISDILLICGGLPIALSVAGSSVAFLVTIHGNFTAACDEYAVDLTKKSRGLGDEQSAEGKSLNAGILLSLEYLEVQFDKLKAKTAPEFEYSIVDLYSSLCVLQNQGWVPVSILSRMWHLDESLSMDVARLFCGMCLSTLQFRESSRRAGLMLHDLHLDFCVRLARKVRSYSLWHGKLLDGCLARITPYLLRATPYTSSSIAADEEGHAKLFSSSGQRFFEHDGYILENVRQHLSIGIVCLDEDTRLKFWNYVNGFCIPSPMHLPYDNTSISIANLNLTGQHVAFPNLRMDCGLSLNYGMREIKLSALEHALDHGAHVVRAAFYDTACRGHLDFKEFLNTMRFLKVEGTYSDFLRCFAAADANMDGSLDTQEFFIAYIGILCAMTISLCAS